VRGSGWRGSRSWWSARWRSWRSSGPGWSRRAATQQRAEIRHVLETKLLRYLVVVGVVAARENMELAAQFRLPRSVSHQAFLTAARGMLEKANAQKELLVKQGMSASLLDDLTLALGEFEKTLEALRCAQGRHSRAGRRAHPSLRSGQVVGASAELEAVARADRRAGACARRAGAVPVWG
jgi:hypothetical protein